MKLGVTDSFRKKHLLISDKGWASLITFHIGLQILAGSKYILLARNAIIYGNSMEVSASNQVRKAMTTEEINRNGDFSSLDLEIQATSNEITAANRWDHFLARWGVNRMGHRVTPGIYSLGRPTQNSPVFVTANYTLSFDSLRSALAEIDGYILVIDTLGVNVWCAAGKGTFGTEELVNRIAVTRLQDVIRHRRIILPQLGASGISAHEVKERTGFSVEYGPIRAADLPEYLKTHLATPEMRKVTFTLGERFVLIPVELVYIILPAIILGTIQYFLGGLFATIILLSAILAGVAVFPILLPWLPTRDFATKGLILGATVVLPFVVAKLAGGGVADVLWKQMLWAGARFLILSPITAFLALNFTGSTPFTSRSGVKKEMFTYIPIMAVMFITGVVIDIARALLA